MAIVGVRTHHIAVRAEQGTRGRLHLSAQSSWAREVIASLVNTLLRWYSTVRALVNSRAPISGLLSPSRANLAMWSSWAVSLPVAAALRLRAVSPVAQSSRLARPQPGRSRPGTPRPAGHLPGAPHRDRRRAGTAPGADPDPDPDRASFSVALDAAREQVILAAGVTAATTAGLAGRIGERVLASLMPPRRLRTSPRVVKRAISRYNAKGKPDRTTRKATINVEICVAPLTGGSAP